MSDSNMKYSLNNECIASSLTQTSNLSGILSDFQVPSLKLTRDEFTKDRTDMGNISVDIYRENDGLSAKVDFLLSSGHDSAEYKGYLKTIETGRNLISAFFAQETYEHPADPNSFFKNGWIYRIAEEQNELSDTSDKIIKFYENDYVIFNQNVRLSNIHISSFDVIKDCDARIDKIDFDVGREGEFVVSVTVENGRLVGNKTSKVTNDYIEEESISQSKISNLLSDLFNISSDLSTVIKRNKDDVSLMGDLSVYSDDKGVLDAHNLTVFFYLNCGRDKSKILRKGFLYRNQKLWDISNDVSNCIFDANEYVMVKNDVVISDLNFSSFDYIRDYDKEISDIHTRIDELSIETFTVSEGHIINSISESKGILSVTERELLSSDVSGLSNFVETKITEKINSLDSEGGTEGEFIVSVKIEDGKLVSTTTSKVGDDYIESESISQYKIKNLSSDLLNISNEISTIVERNMDDVSFMGDISNYVEGTEEIHDFKNLLKKNLNKDESFVLRKGFLFRNQKQWDISVYNGLSVESKILQSNDYILVPSDVVISNVILDSFRYINDYDSAISSLRQEIENREEEYNNKFFLLSGDNVITGKNTFENIQIFNSISANEICVDFAHLRDVGNGKLSDWVTITDTFQSLYSGIINTITYTNIKTVTFSLADEIIKAFQAINGIAEELDIEIEELTEDSIVHDGFVALTHIVNTYDKNLGTNLREELIKIDNRFDINEEGIARHTEQISCLSAKIDSFKIDFNTISSDVSDLKIHYDKTFSKDIPVIQGTDTSADMLRMFDEVERAEYKPKKYVMHLSAGTIVLVPET